MLTPYLFSYSVFCDPTNDIYPQTLHYMIQNLKNKQINLWNVCEILIRLLLSQHHILFLPTTGSIPNKTKYTSLFLCLRQTANTNTVSPHRYILKCHIVLSFEV